MAKATFAAGCFWGIEEAFRQLPGVRDAVSGYIGGHVDNPTYQQVCTGRTGHAEAVEVDYDPSAVSYDRLLEVFFEIHDPTQVNRQGPDVGTQYRSAIFAHGPEQLEMALEARAKVDRAGTHRRPMATQVEPAPTFWRAEEYHQRYFQKNGMTGCHI